MVDEQSRLCRIYKGSRREACYLYVDHANDVAPVPAELMDSLGELSVVMELQLSPERRLARADASQVLALIREQGYFLQMPPGEEQSVV